MKAVLFEKYGPPDVLGLRDVPEPASKPGHIIVRVHAASINPLDFKIRRGGLKIFSGFIRPKLTVLGFDLAGEVTDTGRGVTSFKPGDRVFGMTGIKGGGNAEFVSLAETNAALMPSNISFTEAASIGVAAMTALQALRDLGGLSPGKRVLINGASGGVGTFAVQIAKALGARVTGVCSTGNLELVSSLGADHTVDYTNDDFTRGGEKYDIIFDAVAKRSFRECRGALKPGGVYVTTVPRAADVPCILLSGLSWGKKARFIGVKPKRDDLDYLAGLIEDGRVRPVIDREFTLRETALAHSYAEEGHSKGKNVITVR